MNRRGLAAPGRARGTRSARAALATAIVTLWAAGCGPRPVPGGGAPGGGRAAAPADAGVAIDDGDAAEAAQVAAIEKAMNDLAPAASQCWAAAAVDDYRLAGEVSLYVEVDAGGAVTATVQADTTRDPVLTGCLEAVARAYAWAPPMRGGAAVLPFAFTAPDGQNVIDRRLVPDVADGARVLLDGKSSGNRAASMFELVVPAGGAPAATASERAEVWIYLDEPGTGSIPAAGRGDATLLPPRAVRALRARADAPLRIVVVAVPGGDEDATRRAGVLPSGPASLRDKGRPTPVIGALATATPIALHGPGGLATGTVTILLDQAATGSDRVAASVLALDVGAAVPPHAHAGATELLYVLEGAATMIVDGVTLPIGADSVVQIPPGVEHSATVTERFRAYQFYTPAGPEQRFKAKP
ncbi:MAG: cupin domain-containing protein [Kofleriaceae bacterium]|nr:cupin domain-containing protein [Kofleriaceae bacterium]